MSLLIRGTAGVVDRHREARAENTYTNLPTANSRGRRAAPLIQDRTWLRSRTLDIKFVTTSRMPTHSLKLCTLPQRTIAASCCLNLNSFANKYHLFFAIVGVFGLKRLGGPYSER